MKIIHWDGDGIYDQIDRESDLYFKQGWASLVAEETIKRTGKYKIEKWRADPFVDTIRKREINGVLYKLFPASIWVPQRQFPSIFSPALFSELRE